MTDKPIYNPRLDRSLCWLTASERRVLQHALDYYIKLGPENSFPIQLARELSVALSLYPEVNP